MSQIKTPIEFIRKKIFQLNQAEFADAVGVSQSAVSRWEDGSEPSRKHMGKIRDAARDRGLIWSDSLFFEMPTALAPAAQIVAGMKGAEQ